MKNTTAAAQSVLNLVNSAADSSAQPSRMSSKEIAELTDKEHFHVLRDIKTLIDQGAINESNFGLVEYRDAKGESRPMYSLDFHATLTLVTGYNAVLRSKVIARWLELEGKAVSSSIAQRTTHLLESEVKEGAHLLGQVIGRVSLSDRSRWQLVDRLFYELFGKGVEMLGGGLEQLGKTEERYFRDIPILMINLGEERDVYIPRIMMLAFTDQCCNFSAKAACSQAAMYSVFRRWWLEYTGTEAPEFHILRRSLNCRAIDLLGEPWFVGVEPKEEVQA